jgi:hypothetical protein
MRPAPRHGFADPCHTQLIFGFTSRHVDLDQRVTTQAARSCCPVSGDCDMSGAGYLVLLGLIGIVWVFLFAFAVRRLW